MNPTENCCLPMYLDDFKKCNHSTITWASMSIYISKIYLQSIIRNKI